MISQQSYYTSYYNGSSFGALKYSYCNNNPVIFVDPNGRWAKNVHHQMIRIAVREMVRDGELKLNKSEANAMIKSMQTGSDIADSPVKGNQGVERSYIHYMRDPSKTSDQAKKDSKKYANDNISDFKKTGNFESLGQAAHTMMDAVCPSHVDENGEPRLNNLGVGGMLLDAVLQSTTGFSTGAINNMKEHMEGDENPTVSQLSKGVSNVKNIIREGMGLKNNPNQQQGKEINQDEK